MSQTLDLLVAGNLNRPINRVLPILLQNLISLHRIAFIIYSLKEPLNNLIIEVFLYDEIKFDTSFRTEPGTISPKRSPC